MRGDTICALCTAKGPSALSLIRISGPKAFKITKKLAPFLPEKPRSHQAYLGELKQKNTSIDQVLITYFAEKRSFTGEETLEISCHGGEMYKLVLQILLDQGARLAERGEFSLQAFSNGKMDLIQAEGLLQLIESQNQLVRKQAFSQLKGLLSKKLQEIARVWMRVVSHLEASIDFSLEGIDTWGKQKIQQEIKTLQQDILSLVASYCPLKNLQKGLCFGLFGNVNSGKSSLFNALIKENKAIVSQEAGTTRDPVEAQIQNTKALNIHLKDTAGFHKSTSLGEKQAQARAKKLFSDCDYKILVFDSTNFEKQTHEDFLFKDFENSLVVFTKKDLKKHKCTLQELKTLLKTKYKNLSKAKYFFYTSSLTGEGLQALKNKILSFGDLRQEGFIISNYRHYKSLKIMEQSLKSSLNLLKDKQDKKDLIALELRQGLQALYSILGKQIDDQLLSSIFKEFCIGK